MSRCSGTYLKGKGYTPIYVCIVVVPHTNGDLGINAIGSGLSFEAAMRYASSRVEFMQQLGYEITDEGRPLGGNGLENRESYYYELARGNEVYYVYVNKCPLMHE